MHRGRASIGMVKLWWCVLKGWIWWKTGNKDSKDRQQEEHFEMYMCTFVRGAGQEGRKTEVMWTESVGLEGQG